MNYSILVSAICVLSFRLAAQEARPVVQLGQKLSLQSAAMNESRPFWVYLPPSYAPGSHGAKIYPVLYLLDGESTFPWASEVAQFMADDFQIPEMIIIGIPNVDRQKDLSPAGDVKTSSPGLTSFERFLIEELIPKVDASYRTAPFRILVGHSLGGALAMDTYLRRPLAFQAYIAIDPSLGRDGQILARRAAEVLSKTNDLRSAIFISTAHHGRSLIEPNPESTNTIKNASEHFVQLLKADASPRLRVGYQYFEDENHGSVRLTGLHRGLQFVFESFYPRNLYSLDEPSLIKDHFAKASQQLGFDIVPPEEIVNEIGYQLLYSDYPDKAIECFKLSTTNFPTSADAFSALGEAYATKNDKRSAIANYEKVLELRPNDANAMKCLQKLRPPKQ